jgi:hypothetical protein
MQHSNGEVQCRRTAPREGQLRWTLTNSVACFDVNFSRPEGLKSPTLHQTAKLAIGSTANRASMGFFPLRRLQTRAATNTGSTAPGCAAPSGFLNLLTLCSALVLLALFHARSAPGVEALRGFPLPVAATAFTARGPLSHMRPSKRDEALAPLRRTTRQQRPRERHLGTAPKNDTSTPSRVTIPPRSEERGFQETQTRAA